MFVSRLGAGNGCEAFARCVGTEKAPDASGAWLRRELLRNGLHDGNLLAVLAQPLKLDAAILQANRVSSLPMPTLVPGWMWVPR